MLYKMAIFIEFDHSGQSEWWGGFIPLRTTFFWILKLSVSRRDLLLVQPRMDLGLKMRSLGCTDNFDKIRISKAGNGLVNFDLLKVLEKYGTVVFLSIHAMEWPLKASFMKIDHFCYPNYQGVIPPWMTIFDDFKRFFEDFLELFSLNLNLETLTLRLVL